jgi:acetyltransferase-like isoleucine patch superfamily enzyme
VVNGDTCKIASSIALDSSSILSAPIKIGNQGTLGASAVVLPGLIVGAQATLAPLAVPAIGATIEAKTVYVGAPATAVKVSPIPHPLSLQSHTWDHTCQN